MRPRQLHEGFAIALRGIVIEDIGCKFCLGQMIEAEQIAFGREAFGLIVAIAAGAEAGFARHVCPPKLCLISATAGALARAAVFRSMVSQTSRVNDARRCTARRTRPISSWLPPLQ